MIDNNPQEKPKRRWSDEFVEATVAFLVGGLDCGTRAIEDSCAKLLADFGPVIVPQLLRIVRRDELTYGHSSAVLNVINAVKATDRRSPGVVTRLCECIALMIKRNKMELVRDGLLLAKYLPEHSLSDFLVDTALSHRFEGPYFNRLLLAVELTGESPSKPRLDQLRRLQESKERPISKSCKRLLEKIHRGELRAPSYQGGFDQHPVALDEPDDLPIPPQYLLQLRGCSIRRGRRGSIICQVWQHQQIVELIPPASREYCSQGFVRCFDTGPVE